MDSYLEIALQVLRLERRPLGPRDILRRGYELDLVPARLHGKTQHKTLQARVSEDILTFKERSHFFRTSPGKFFLREFLSDERIPTEHRTPILARRRKRELKKDNVLAIQQSACLKALSESAIPADFFRSSTFRDNYHYVPNTNGADIGDLLIWSYVVVRRDTQVLTYRQGRYREDRDPFVLKRTLGFYSPLSQDDLTLFDTSDHGVVSNGLKILGLDLGVSDEPFWHRLSDRASLEFLVPDVNEFRRALLGIVVFDCPDWLEPLSRRLAIHDLQWMDLRSPPNHVDDFDPWSQKVLEHVGAMFRRDLKVETSR